jgi:flagellar hook-associated protein 1 FlgK
VLTIDAQPGGGAPQENVTVSAVSFNPATGAESITAAFTNAHAAGFSIASAATQTLGQFYGNFVSQVGNDTQTANAGVTSQTALSSNIDNVRQSIDGINIDEETQNLIKYQNAYQAAARTMNVLDSLLNTVITTLGVQG